MIRGQEKDIVFNGGTTDKLIIFLLEPLIMFLWAKLMKLIGSIPLSLSLSIFLSHMYKNMKI